MPTETEKAQLAGYLSHRRDFGTMVPDADIQRANRQIVEEAYIAVFGRVVGDNPDLPAIKVLVVIYGPLEATEVYTWDTNGSIQQVPVDPTVV